MNRTCSTSAGVRRHASSLVGRGVLFLLCAYRTCAGQSGDFTYEVNPTNRTVTISSGAAGGVNVTVPATIDGMPVTSIGNVAFFGHTALTSISIPGTVTNIGTYTFYGCIGLTNIIVDELNPKYRDVDGVLFDRDRTVLVRYPPGRSASYSIPNGVGMVADLAFRHCGGLTNITVPEGVVSIGASCFAECTALANLVMPNSVAKIGVSAFSDCSNLTSLVLPDQLVTIPEIMCIDCVRLKNINIPAGVTNIGNQAFAWCSRFETVKLPGSLSSIGDWAFGYCPLLTSVTLPAGLTHIGISPFASCGLLKNITVEAQNLNYCDQDGIVFNREGSALVLYPPGRTGPYAIPDGVTSVDKYAFSYSGGIEDVAISQYVTNIGAYAFLGCTGLTNISVDSVNACYSANGGVLFNRDQSILIQCVTTKAGTYVMPNTVTEIGSAAFDSCGGLRNILFSSRLTSIDSGAFQSCTGLTSVILPVSLTNIGDFAFNECGGLIGMYFRGNAPNQSRFLFGNGARTPPVTLYHLAGTTGWMYGSPLWEEPTTFTYETINQTTIAITNCVSMRTNITVPETIDGLTVVSIGAGAFASCTNMLMLTLPNSVTNIGDSACAGIAQLRAVSMGTNVSLIGASAFNGCRSLASLKLAPRLAEIGDAAFKSCSGLATLVLPANLSSIGISAFAYCVNLTNVSIGSDTTGIGSAAFFSCSRLSKLFIPQNLVNIGDAAFSGCSALAEVVVDPKNPAFASVDGVLFTRDQTSLVYYPNARGGYYAVPSAVTHLGNSAFAYCGLLQNVFLPGALIHLGNDVFLDCARLINITVAPNNPVFSAMNGVLFSQDKTVLVQFPPGRQGSYPIPEGVTAVGQYGFSSCAGMTEINVPEGVKTIGGKAFAACFGLTSLTLPTSLTSIGDRAFHGCTNLTRVFFKGNAPASVESPLFQTPCDTSIYHLAGSAGWDFTFEGRPTFIWTDEVPFAYRYIDPSSIEITKYLGPGGSVVVPETIDGMTVTGIGTNAFYSCAALAGVSLPGKVTRIADSAFALCSGLTDCSLPGSLRSIEGAAFSACAALKNMDLPSTLTNLGPSVFVSCHSLTSVVLPDALAAIPDYAFNNCRGLTNVQLADSVAQIGDGAFGGCSSLRGIVLGDNVIRIGKSSFYGCVLTKVSFGKGLSLIPESAFASCRILKSVSFGDGVRGIGESAFAGCWSLASLSVPHGVTNVGAKAFSDCTGLTNINLSTNLSGLEPSVFAGCASLVNITISANITNIPSEAFSDCRRLSAVTLPKSVVAMDAWAFNNCGALARLVFEGNAPTLTGGNFPVSTKPTVYYSAGTTGWGATFGGRPTALLEQTYSQWAVTSGLTGMFPDASGEQDDADEDGMTNLQEKVAGTDPTDPKSALIFESVARPRDLSDDDKTAVGLTEFALYFQSVPGKSYALLSSVTLKDEWATVAKVTATTKQKRVVLGKLPGQGFYRVMVRE